MNSTLTPVRRRLLERIAQSARPVRAHELPRGRFNFLPDLWRAGYVTSVCVRLPEYAAVVLPWGVGQGEHCDRCDHQVGYVVTPRGLAALK